MPAYNQQTGTVSDGGGTNQQAPFPGPTYPRNQKKKMAYGGGARTGVSASPWVTGPMTTDDTNPNYRSPVQNIYGKPINVAGPSFGSTFAPAAGGQTGWSPQRSRGVGVDPQYNNQLQKAWQMDRPSYADRDFNWNRGPGGYIGQPSTGWAGGVRPHPGTGYPAGSPGLQQVDPGFEGNPSNWGARMDQLREHMRQNGGFSQDMFQGGQKMWHDPNMYAMAPTTQGPGYGSGPNPYASASGAGK